MRPPTTGASRKPRPTAALLALVVAACAAPGDASREVDAAYVPGPGNDWETRTPEEVGMDPAAVQAAIDYTLAHETTQIPDDPGIYLRDRFEGKMDTERHEAIVGRGMHELHVTHGPGEVPEEERCGGLVVPHVGT